MNKGVRTLFLYALVAASALLRTTVLRADDAPSTLAIKAAKIYIGNGETADNVVILINDGRIKAVGPDLTIPDGAQVVELDGCCVTPGLIDANARVESADLVPFSRDRPEGTMDVDGDDDWGHQHEHDGGCVTPGLIDANARVEPADLVPFSRAPSAGTMHVGGDDGDHKDDFATGVRISSVISEQSSEVVPHTRVLDSLNLRGTDFDRLVRGGVTTVYASPDASSVIGPRGTILHTAGPLDRRVLVPTAAVKATIGSDPNSLGGYNRSPYGSVSHFTRRPNSRMGLTWVFRKAFYDAIRRGEGVEAYGADTSPPEASPVLRDVLEGKVPLRIQARLQQDIHTALRLADEFQLKFTFEEVTEAYRCIETIKAAAAAGVIDAVIFGPIYERPSGIRARTSESRQSRYYTFRALIEAGIPTALSAQDLREEDGLARQAMYAMRFGVTFDDALKAVTRTPAEMLGLDEQLGTIEPGKRADLVVWSGQPLAATSMATVVVIDGQIVVDRR